MESLDKIGQHEKFLAKNFESLDGDEDFNEGAGDSPKGKNRYSPRSVGDPHHHLHHHHHMCTLGVFKITLVFKFMGAQG